MKASITGINGFLGSALRRKLEGMGWEVSPQMRKDADYVFLFGSPSSNHWFDQALSYSVRETVENFINAVEFCRQYHIKLVYPSSGTVYQGQTPYAKCKLVLDTLASIYGGNILGVRIFAGYGVGEWVKNDYTSVVYLFTKQMQKGKSPVIWGDGSQTRDFIYVDDIVDNLIKFKDDIGTVDIGTGVGISFIELVELINRRLDKDIKTKFIAKPDKYIEHTVCQKPCNYQIKLVEGIDRIINE